MNLFFRELASHKKGTVIWSLALIVFMFLSMAKYTTLSGDAAASQQIMQAFPATLQAVFGMTGLNLTTIQGYYGTCFIFLAVMLAIHAGMLGAELVAKEETGKTAEFLYVKPVSRARVLTQKLLAGLVLLGIVGTAAYAASYWSMAWVNDGRVPTGTLNLFTTALIAIQLVFFALGVASGSALGVPKKAATITATITFTAYIAYVLWGLSPSFSWMQFVSPFAYFAAKDMIASNSLNTGWLLLCASIGIAAICVSYLRYTRRDFKV